MPTRLSGNKSEAQKVLSHLDELSTQNYISSYSRAIIYAGLGEKDQVFASLERAYQERSYFLAVYLPTDSRLDGLHADPALYRSQAPRWLTEVTARSLWIP